MCNHPWWRSVTWRCDASCRIRDSISGEGLQLLAPSFAPCVSVCDGQSHDDHVSTTGHSQLPSTTGTTRISFGNSTRLSQGCPSVILPSRCLRCLVFLGCCCGCRTLTMVPSFSRPPPLPLRMPVNINSTTSHFTGSKAKLMNFTPHSKSEPVRLVSWRGLLTRPDTAGIRKESPCAVR